MQVRKQQLELDMEQQTGSKQEKEYIKAVYCYPAYLTSMQSSIEDECNCAVVWAFFGIAFPSELEWNLNFSSPVATAEFSKFAGILSAALSQHRLSGFEIAQLEFHHLH